MIDVINNGSQFAVCLDAWAIRCAVQQIRRHQFHGFAGSSHRCRRSRSIETVVDIAPAIVQGDFVQVPSGNLSVLSGYTRELCSRSVSFTHDTPLDPGNILITIDLFNREPITLLADILWQRTRFISCYTSAATLLGVVDRAKVPDFASGITLG